MKVGSLFSGGGLGDFGFMAAGMEIAWQCEIDPYCQKILELRYPESKKYTDIKTLKGADLEPVDIITGGFPCQPFSNAGSKMGKSDDRHLWPEMFRIIQEVKPAWVVGENVSGFVDMALDDVCLNLESAGYEVGTLVFPAHALGAWHRRERVWIVGYSGLLGSQKHEVETAGVEQSGEGVIIADPKSTGTGKHVRGLRGLSERCGSGKEGVGQSENVADADKERLQGGWTNGDTFGRQGQDERPAGLCGADAWRAYWEVEPAVGRVANGIADRVHRLKMLGNGQVPACTYVIGSMIMELNHPRSR